jgi:hypothetical protein
MDHLIFHPGGKNSANSRSIVFGFGQKYRWHQSFTFVRKYVECNRIVCFGTMDNRPQKEKRLLMKFWPWIFSTTCFIAVLINNISHQILRFFMLKKALDLWLMKKLYQNAYSKPFLFVDEIKKSMKTGGRSLYFRWKLRFYKGHFEHHPVTPVLS